MAERIAVPHLTLPDERHRLDAPVRVVRKAPLVLGGTGRLEMVEEQERVEVIEPPGADAPAEMHSCASTTGSGVMTYATGRSDWLMADSFPRPETPLV